MKPMHKILTQIQHFEIIFDRFVVILWTTRYCWLVSEAELSMKKITDPWIRLICLGGVCVFKRCTCTSELKINCIWLTCFNVTYFLIDNLEALQYWFLISSLVPFPRELLHTKNPEKLILNILHEDFTFNVNIF